jgi:hypothetical protein
MKKIFILAGLLAFSSCAFAQSSYPNHAQLSTRLKTLSSKYATSTKLESIGKSKGGKDLFAITLSKGDASAKPAIAILAGADGAHLAGTEVALQLAEKFVASDSLAKILETKTFISFLASTLMHKNNFQQNSNSSVVATTLIPTTTVMDA